jgi:hypothetical protein
MNGVGESLLINLLLDRISRVFRSINSRIILLCGVSVSFLSFPTLPNPTQ